MTPKTVKFFCVPTNNKAPVLPCVSHGWSGYMLPQTIVALDWRWQACTIWHCKIKLVWEWNGVNVGARAAGKSVEGFDVIKVFAFCRMSPSCRELLQIFCWSSCLSFDLQKSQHKKSIMSTNTSPSLSRMMRQKQFFGQALFCPIFRYLKNSDCVGDVCSLLSPLHQTLLASLTPFRRNKATLCLEKCLYL